MINQSDIEKMRTNYNSYADVIYDILYTAGNFNDWYPYEYLGISEMCTAFAIGYDWLDDYWK